MRLLWRRKHEPPHIPTDTGGEQARVRAEAALAGALHRRQEVHVLRSIWASELAANHFAEAITATFRGER